MGKFAKRGYRVGVFLDSVNIYCAMRDRFGTGINHGVLLKACLDDNQLYRAIAYAVQSGDMDAWLMAIQAYGYEVKIKQLVVDDGYTRRGDWDIGITIDVIKMLPAIDMVVLCTGDGDFLPLVHYIQEQGKVVRVAALATSSATYMRNAADEWLEIDKTYCLSQKEDKTDG